MVRDSPALRAPHVWRARQMAHLLLLFRTMASTTNVVRQIREAAVPIVGRGGRDLEPLLERIGDAQIVLLGESSHGTHEFYEMREAITRRLITARGFRAVAIEADWPATSHVDRWVRFASAADPEAEEALESFRRFPGWMWRNIEVSNFIRWLRLHNLMAMPDRKVGLYGLDLFGPRGEPIGDARDVASSLAAADGEPRSVRFFAEQSARVARNAAGYRRALAGPRAAAWNLRDRHMAETIDALACHLESASAARIIVWAHNSHVGDSRATEMGRSGEVNLGQLLRDRWGADVVSVGLTTHHGTVTAARQWDAAPERMALGPAITGSWDAVLHETGLQSFLLLLTGTGRTIESLDEERLERAVGVVYFPQTERASHYFHARLAAQFDALIHLDETSATAPLELEERTGMAAGP